jgi:Protein of unknown function (DUF2786)
LFTDKLVKLLNLSSSDNDHEALAAIRAANLLVRKAGLSWAALLREGVVSEKPKTVEEPPDSYESMFAYIRVNAWEDFDDTFVKDIEEKYKTYGRLTARQRIGLVKTYNAVRNHVKQS